MNGNKSVLAFVIPGIIITVIALFGIDYGMSIYYNNKLLTEAKEVITLVANQSDQFEENREYINYAKEKYVEYYEDNYHQNKTVDDFDDINIVVNDDGSILLFNYQSYVSVWGSLSRSADTSSSVGVIAYKNDYSEWVVEEYDSNKVYAIHTTETTTTATN